MATFFGQLMHGVSLYDTPFAIVLDTVCPGFPELVEGARNSQVNWWDTALAMLPTINATDEQRAFILLQIEAAQAGQQPVMTAEIQKLVQAHVDAIQKEIATPGQTQKADLVKLVSWLSAGIAVMNWVTG